jgi:hypothetical protein
MNVPLPACVSMLAGDAISARACGTVCRCPVARLCAGLCPPLLLLRLRGWLLAVLLAHLHRQAAIRCRFYCWAAAACYTALCGMR